MPRAKDPMWEYVEPDPQGGNRCKLCQQKFTGGISRMKYHLAKLVGNDVRPCTNVTDNVVELALKAVNELQDKPRVNKRGRTSESSVHPSSGSGTNSNFSSISNQYEAGAAGPSSCQPKLMELMKKKEKEAADLLGVKFFVSRNIAFNVLRCEELRDWCLAIGRYGPGYVPPGSEIARTRILGTLKDEATSYVKSVTETWGDTGCTLMSDSWTDSRKRPHVNLLASSPSGIVFLKSTCVKLEKQTGEFLANFIISGMDEIGPHNVVQIVTDNASNYGAAGAIIEARYPHVFKTACASHCIDLILEDIDRLPLVMPIMTSARSIVNYIYKYKGVLALMRTFTDGRELKRPGATRFATQFLCLQSVLKEQEALRFLVSSNGWESHKKPRDGEADKVAGIIQSSDFWVKGKEIITIVEPLVQVLRMTDSDHYTLGYIYHAMHKVKASIKSILKDDIEKYGPYWKIIDDRWSRRLHSPIHAVAAYFNPKLFYERTVKMDNEIREGIGIVRHRTLSIQDKRDLTEEINLYHSRSPKIFSLMAIDALDNTHPRLWWDIYGGDLTIMRKLAMRLLSQTCSSSACERNWSAFDAANTKKRNRLEPTRLHDLVYVRMNLHMKKISAKKMQENLKPIDLDNIIAFPDISSLEGDTMFSEEQEDDTEGDEDDDSHYEGEDDDDDDASNVNLANNSDEVEFQRLINRVQ